MDTEADLSRRTRKLVFVLKISFGVVLTVALVVGFFRLAGGWGWTEGWAYVGLFTLGQSVSRLDTATRSFLSVISTLR